jgi:hypothetical protein
MSKALYMRVRRWREKNGLGTTTYRGKVIFVPLPVDEEMKPHIVLQERMDSMLRMLKLNGWLPPGVMPIDPSGMIIFKVQQNGLQESSEGTEEGTQTDA